jgi:hypothetical protein
VTKNDNAGEPVQSREQIVAKDKKKKKKDKKDDGKGVMSGKVGKRLREISENRLVAEVVAAALVGAASALKDSKKARQLAANAGDELEALASRGAKQGNALWQLALDVGQKSLEALTGDAPSKAIKSAQAKPKPKARARSTAAAASKPAKSRAGSASASRKRSPKKAS